MSYASQTERASLLGERGTLVEANKEGVPAVVVVVVVVVVVTSWEWPTGRPQTGLLYRYSVH